MTRYIALLRGINISGKHKISMTELKKDFENIGFTEIKTYLNSGNVIFSSNKTDKENITRQLETMLKDRFDFDIPIAVIPKEQLIDILHNAPEWWGNEDKEIYDNLIFIIPPTTFTDIFNKIGEPKHELQKRDLLVFQPKRLSKNELVAKNSKRKHPQQLNDKNSKYREKNRCNVGFNLCLSKLIPLSLTVKLTRATAFVYKTTNFYQQTASILPL